MIKIDYTFTAIAPIHTGSDEDAGTTKTLRRQKIAIEPVIYESRYTHDQLIDAIVSLLYAVYRSLDVGSMDSSRKMHIWDEFYSKIIKASATRTKFQFLHNLCSSWGLRSVIDDNIVKILETMNDAEFFDVVRSETHYLILKLRNRIKGESVDNNLFNYSDKPAERYVKTYEMIPCISGNSIRGVLRRLAMYDFCELAEIGTLQKEIYHQWFTGGMLNESTQYEDIEKREKLIRLNPILAVFGSAIGNMTIEGLLSVGHAYPVCSEVGTGERSYWEYLDTIFQTRYDSSKTERQIQVEGEASENPTQMKYEYEVFAKGTKFTHGFRFLDFDEIETSAFWRVINLFKQNPVICGMWAIGNAEIDLSELPSNDDSVYVQYVQDNKEAIKNELSQ